MQRLGGAVIPMRPEFSVLLFYMGGERTLERMPGLPAGEPVAPARIEYLNEVTRFFLSDREGCMLFLCTLNLRNE
jgi:hypothetical protein